MRHHILHYSTFYLRRNGVCLGVYKWLDLKSGPKYEVKIIVLHPLRELKPQTGTLRGSQVTPPSVMFLQLNYSYGKKVAIFKKFNKQAVQNSPLRYS